MRFQFPDERLRLLSLLAVGPVHVYGQPDNDPLNGSLVDQTAQVAYVICWGTTFVDLDALSDGLRLVAEG